jgi:hypothetical protein
MSDLYRLNEQCYKYKEGAAPVTVVRQGVKEPWYDPNEGMQILVSGFKYPRSGFLDLFALNAIDGVKKYIKNWLLFFSRIRYFLPLFIFLPRSILEEWIVQFSEFSHQMVKEFVYQEDRLWCRVPREIQRVLKKILKSYRWDETNEKLNGEYEKFIAFGRIIDLICVALENDHVYRYWLQDILSEMNKVEFIIDPAKETKRDRKSVV